MSFESQINSRIGICCFKNEGSFMNSLIDPLIASNNVGHMKWGARHRV